MAKIKIEIDTESTQDTRKVQFLAHPKISVISAISATPALKDSFNNGVNDSNVQVHFVPNQGYKKNNISKLKTAVQNANSADLIATAGGLAAYEAASSEATISFVSVTGEVPSGPPDHFKGGVSLESSPSNSLRVSFLKTDFNFTVPEIGLFYNPNSYMTDEVDNWNNLVGTTNQTFPGGNDSNGNNDKSAYATDFTAAKIPSAIKALVISADPFFQDTKEQLIIAANAWIAAAPSGVNRYVCYPTQEYANKNGTRPTAGRTTLFGPELANAYNLLGQVAKIALNAASGSPPLILRIQNTRNDL
jgi:hypothetical protein